MATLSERDLRRILGDQHNAETDTGPAAELVRRNRQKKDNRDTLEDRKFTAFAAVVMGIGLFVSAMYTATGNAFLIQNSIAVLLLVAGIAWYITALKLEKRSRT